MAYGDKIGLIIFSCTVLFVVLCWLGYKIYTYRVNKYNNDVKNKLKNAVKYLFGEIYADFLDNDYLCISTSNNLNLCAKTIFVDKRNVEKMVSFANHVYKKYRCEYTHRILCMAYDIGHFAHKYKSLDDYLYQRGIKTYSTLNEIINKHKDEIIEIEKKKFFNK